MLNLLVAIVAPLLIAGGPAAWYAAQANQAGARADEFANVRAIKGTYRLNL